MQKVARAIAWLFVGVIFAAPIILLAIALTSAFRQVVFLRDALRTDGTIINLRCPAQSTRHGYQCLPIFRFTAADGQIYVVESFTGGKFSDFRIGRPVHVLYLKDHPQTARIDIFRQLWVPTLIFGILGGLLAIFPALILRARMNQRRAAAFLTQSART